MKAVEERSAVDPSAQHVALPPRSVSVVATEAAQLDPLLPSVSDVVPRATAERGIPTTQNFSNSGKGSRLRKESPTSRWSCASERRDCSAVIRSAGIAASDALSTKVFSNSTASGCCTFVFRNFSEISTACWRSPRSRRRRAVMCGFSAMRRETDRVGPCSTYASLSHEAIA